MRTRWEQRRIRSSQKRRMRKSRGDKGGRGE